MCVLEGDKRASLCQAARGTDTGGGLMHRVLQMSKLITGMLFL